MEYPYIVYWCARQHLIDLDEPQSRVKRTDEWTAREEAIYPNESVMLIPTLEAFEEAS